MASRRVLWKGITARRLLACLPRQGYATGGGAEIVRESFVSRPHECGGLSGGALWRRFVSTSTQRRPPPEEEGEGDDDRRRGDPLPGEKEASHGWSLEELFTLPNSISLGRLVLGPVLAWAIVEGHTTPAFWGLVVGGISDWLDGYVAKRTEAKTVLGSYLDPLADKVFVGSVASSMVYANLLSAPLVLLIVARDTTLVLGALYERGRTLKWKWSNWGEFFDIKIGGAPKLQPILSSKINTALQFVLISASLLDSGEQVVSVLSLAVAGTTLYSWVSYIEEYHRKKLRR